MSLLSDIFGGGDYDDGPSHEQGNAGEDTADTGSPDFGADR